MRRQQVIAPIKFPKVAPRNIVLITVETAFSAIGEQLKMLQNKQSGAHTDKYKISNALRPAGAENAIKLCNLRLNYGWRVSDEYLITPNDSSQGN